MTLPRSILGLSRAVALVALAACTTTSSSVQDAGSNSPWLKPSPGLRQQIEDAAKRLPWTHGLERVDAIAWFARVGEPAYPTLLQMVVDPRKDVAGAALAALGATRDSRLVEPLRALPWPSAETSTDLALERARTLLRLGDWQMVPHLITGLRDDRLMTRALCAQALWESTHERFDYDPKSEGEERENSVRQWDAWWRERERDPMLKSRLPEPQVETPARSPKDD